MSDSYTASVDQPPGGIADVVPPLVDQLTVPGRTLVFCDDTDIAQQPVETLQAEPRTPEDVLRVHHDDAGAYDVAGTNQSRGAPLSAASFDASIDETVPGTYNEWRVRGAKPVGIFVLNPANIQVRQKFTVPGPYGPGEVIAAGPISLDAVRTAFPGQPIWTMTPAGPCQL